MGNQRQISRTAYVRIYLHLSDAQCRLKPSLFGQYFKILFVHRPSPALRGTVVPLPSIFFSELRTVLLFPHRLVQQRYPLLGFCRYWGLRRPLCQQSFQSLPFSQTVFAKLIQTAPYFPIALFSSAIPFCDSSMDWVSDSRARSGLWKPSEFSAVQNSQRIWALRCWVWAS